MANVHYSKYQNANLSTCAFNESQCKEIIDLGRPSNTAAKCVPLTTVS